MAEIEEAGKDVCEWIFVCPFCGQVRTVDFFTGTIKIIVKGLENPIP